MTRSALRRVVAVMVCTFCASLSATSVHASSYVAFRGNGTATVWAFDPVLGRWLALPDAPAPVGDGAALVNVWSNGNIYALRGGMTAEFWRYSPSTKLWTRLADTPARIGAGGGIASSLWGTPTVFVLQGGGSDALWRYDLGTRSWSLAAPVPVPVGAGGGIAMASYGTQTFTVVPGGGSPRVYSYDAIANAWSVSGNAPDFIGAGGAVANLYNGCDYVLGGGTTTFFSVPGPYCYANPGRLADAPVPIQQGGALAASMYQGEFLYAFAGQSAAFLRYSVSQNAWTSVADAPQTVGLGAALAEYPGTLIGIPLTPVTPLPAFGGSPTITINPPLTFVSEVIRGAGLEPSAGFCIFLGDYNAGCGGTDAAGAFAYNFSTTGAPSTLPRLVSVVFNDGTMFTATQTSNTYPQDVALAPAGSLHFDPPVVGGSAEISGSQFPPGCESSVLYSVTGGVLTGLGAFPTSGGSWRYNFNYPAASDRADAYRWTGSGACNGYMYGGANPGGGYPRTVPFTDLAAGAAAAVSPSSLSFTATSVGGSSALSLIVRNSGTGYLVVRDASVLGLNAGEFLVGANTCAFMTLAPGATCSVGITFRPVANGTRVSTLQISTNALGGLSLVPLSGVAASTFGQFTGRVTDVRSGTAVAGAAVGVFDAAGAAVLTVATDTTGRYVTPQLPPGIYYAKSGAAGYDAQLYNQIACALGCTVAAGTPISVPGNITVGGIDFALALRPSLIGTVTDTEGAPVSGVALLLSDMSGAAVQTATTDAAGVYRVYSLSSGFYHARTSNAVGLADELYDNIACALGCDVTTGTPISVTVGFTASANFSLPPNTPSGPSVDVQPRDPDSGLSLVNVFFSNVIASGRTQVHMLADGLPPPLGFAFGSPSLFFDVTTTATFSGTLTTCLDYSSITFADGAPLRLLHIENGVWVDRTSSVDTVHHVVCGTTTSLSPFAIAALLDSTPPAVQAVVTGAQSAGWYTGPVTVSWVTQDPESGIQQRVGCDAVTLSTATAGTQLTCTAVNGVGLSASSSVTIRVDPTPPAIGCSASPSIVLPPNGKPVEVRVTVTVTDSGSGPAGFVLQAIASNETLSAGDVVGFATGTAATAGSVRATRSGGSAGGRIYTLKYVGRDVAGNTASCTTTVTVPHDQR